MNLTPSKKDRKKFDIDLAYGKVREDLIKEMLQDKSQSNWTGGLSTTKFFIWALSFILRNLLFLVIIFEINLW